MIQLYPAASRFSHDQGWLRGSFGLSFGGYYDQDNTEFGPLRVFNDDVIAAGRGFGAHPHNDMEIVSIVLYGKLKHEDNLGHSVVTGFGEVQRMSAGSGVVHTEGNPSETEELNLLQLWFMPEKRGLEPSYEASRFDTSQLEGRLLPVVSREPVHGAARIHQDLTIYLSKLEALETLSFTQPKGRRMYLFVIEGKLEAAGEERVQLATRDAARITDTERLELTAQTDSFFMLIDLP
ncbi:pirin family protein [Paenibacillus thalictri]|uniref:Pirin family protein n=1 Tax=Paenibacillus thalictri TaxID=2527873 RepID=A0A4Q9DV41_9BACL|nr:pirin family protein [Paenibacillus thalictri]TBL79820.1 pirin family protein [Paenibacillus thalictri]